jgi:CheY-like chemotaxis protein
VSRPAQEFALIISSLLHAVSIQSSSSTVARAVNDRLLPLTLYKVEKFVLSVEDDDAAHYLLEIAFRELGPAFHLYRVTNGTEAFKFLSHAEPFVDVPRPDLILSDLNLPGMDGIELLAKLQTDIALRTIPVVVISSSCLDSDRAKCLALGAKRFITKNSSFDQFRRQVDSRLPVVALAESQQSGQNTSIFAVHLL